jgi:hypothetical protein
MSAGGGIAVGVGVGLMRVVQCGKGAKVDLVPADHVVNSIIATAFFLGLETEPCFKVVQCGSSHLNPITPQGFLGDLVEYAAKNPFENQILAPKITEAYTDMEYKIRMQV